MRTTLLASLCVIGLLLVPTHPGVVGEERSDKSPAEFSDGIVEVRLKGALLVGTRQKTGANPNARPQDLEAWELYHATVMAGGTYIELDWSRSTAIRDELLWWSVPRHGDLRNVQAEVTGRMIFKRAKQVTNLTRVHPGVSDETPVPVVVVESLQVRLVDLDGRPSGPQHDRKTVRAEGPKPSPSRAPKRP